MKSYVITEPARDDMLGIWNYIAQDSFQVADRVIDELEADMEKIAAMPGLGHRRSDSPDPRYRFWTVYSYLIVYHPDSDPLEIVRVVHGQRDVPAVLQPDS